MAPRDRGWVHELTYGTMRLRGRLDHLLDHHLDAGLASVDGRVADVLRLGAYQLLHMGSVPAYAAVSQAVEQARATSRRRGAGPLVNAVLRSVARAGEDPGLFPDFTTDPAGHLASWGSHPRWLVQRWLARWPAEEVRALVEADNRIPPLVLAPLRATAESTVRALAMVGIESREVDDTASVELAAGSDPGIALGAMPLAVIQDPAATLVADYVGVGPGSTAADLCAAPGGKALVLAGRGAYVLAADRSRARLDLVLANVRRTGMSVGVVRAEAERPPVRPVPFVLVDAPCTGTGTLRRHPDARWRLGSEDIGRMADVQRRILDGAARCVAPGGILVYATCSLEDEENEGQVESFLERHADFRLAGPGPVDSRYLEGRGRLRVLPQRTGFDGAYAARLERVGR